MVRMCWLGCVAAVAACAASSAPRSVRGLEGVEELDEALADLTAQCTFASGTLTLALVAGDTAIIARGATGAIEVNGFPCGAATTSTLRAIDVTGDAGDQTLLLDYGAGLFARGTATRTGVMVDLGDGADGLRLIGAPGADTWTAGAAGFTLDGDTFLDVTASHVEDTIVNLGAGADRFTAGGSAVTGAALATAITIYGSAGADSLRGGAGDDTLDGGEDADTLVGGAASDGADVLRGGAGTDTVDYGSRSAPIIASIDGVANDGEASEGDDIGADVEVIQGGLGADILTGGPGGDTLRGGPGDDTLRGGPGADTLGGDAGDDTLDEGTGPSGADTLAGGAGRDTVTYAGRAATVTVIVDTLANDGEAGEGDRVSVDVEVLIGGDGDDVLTGGAIDNVLVGGPGDDTLTGGEGNDRFDMGTDPDGADRLVGGAGTDLADYGARSGDLTVVMDGATSGGEPSEGDLVGIDVEALTGGSGDDDLTGNTTDNLLEGGAGVDALAGLAGEDVLDGGAGDDTLDCGAGEGDINLDATLASPALGCEL